MPFAERVLPIPRDKVETSYKCHDFPSKKLSEYSFLNALLAIEFHLKPRVNVRKLFIIWVCNKNLLENYRNLFSTTQAETINSLTSYKTAS
jgi:hypothetical protein